MQTKNISKVNFLIYFFFTAYVLFMMYLLFFARIHISGMASVGVNLTPFYTIRSQLQHIWTTFAFVNLFANTFALSPLGLYLPVIIKGRSFLFYTIIILIICVLIETIQWLFRLGAADIDDVILNFAGGVLGLIAFVICRKWIKDEVKVKVFILCISFIAGLLFTVAFLYYFGFI